MNEFEFSNTNKRYHTLDYHFKSIFNQKVGRIPINAGFTCPNIDGTKAFGGCTFCSIKGSGDYAGFPTDDLLKQWADGKVMMEKKWPNAKFIAYFQAFSNTYADVDILKEKYETFVSLDECIGISIATRPDCLDDEIIEYLADLNKRTYLLVELGLQSIHESTSGLINRMHSTKEYEDAVKKLHANGIKVISHIINGLPKETPEMMLETAKFVARLNVSGIKIHLLHVVNNTKMVKQLNNGFLELLTKEQYIDIVCEQLKYLPKEMVIHRLTGDAPKEEFIGPIWSRKKTIVLNDIDKQMLRLNIFQGQLYGL
jgi:radical SAM protein (TIGR01212 family)